MEQQKMSITEYLNGVAKTMLDIGPMVERLSKENEALKAEIEALKKPVSQPGQEG